MYPRLRLTGYESKFCSKYEEPGKSKMPVLRRFYAGEINLNSSIRQDQETLQISRRVRAMAFTACGDIQQIEIQISDVTGEQITPDFIPVNNLILGTVADPRGLEYFNSEFTADVGYLFGMVGGFSISPLVFEPNIVLSSNQTLTIAARPINPEIVTPLHLDFCFHIWEFPGMPGSPL